VSSPASNPKISGLQPRNGSPVGGNRVTITGSGLSAVTSATFGAHPATVLTALDTALTVLTPPGAGTVDVEVVSAGGTATATAAFAYLGGVTIDVVRPDDLLVVSFQFPNGGVDAGPPLQVIRSDATQPQTVVVKFPPQHIAESDFNVNAPVGAPPIPAVMSGTSRLVFTVPASQAAVPLTLAALLDWSSWTLVVPEAAGTEPAPSESALELPYGLMVSTDGSARWQHRAPAAVLDGIAELWRTDLNLPEGPSTLLIRWSSDPSNPSDVQANSLPPPAVRGQLVQAGPGTIRRLTLSSLGAWADLQLGNDVETDGKPPAQGTGGSTLAQTWMLFWHQITGAGRTEFLKLEGQTGWLLWPGFRALWISVTERKPVVASDGTATETLITTWSLLPIKTEVDFTDPALGLPNAPRGLPFKRIRLVTGKVVALDKPADGPSPPQAHQNPVQFHMVATDWADADVDLVQPLLFVSDAWIENHKETPNPPDPNNPPPILDPGLLSSGLSGLPPAQLPGALVTYVAPKSASDSVALPTSQMSFVLVAPSGRAEFGNPQVPPLVPVMAGAVVDVPAVGHAFASAGASGNVTITYYKNYLTGADNHAEVFARFVPGLDGLTDPATDPDADESSAPLGLGIPAQQAGGLASVNLGIGGLSRTKGAIAGQLRALAGGDMFNPATIFADLPSKLLGGIDLGQVIADLIPLSALPVLAHQQDGTQVVTTFDWSPPLVSQPPGGILTFSADPQPALELHGKTVTPLNAPGSSKYTLSGTLSNFGLTFFGDVTVAFDLLSFSVQSGQKVDLSVGTADITFQGDLNFVNVLASLLPSSGWSDPPFLTVTDDGVSAGYTLAVPSAGVGILSLENLAITAALDLPYAGSAAIRLAFAERTRPFLVTVAFIAGGGYLAVEVDTTGIRRVEGSLEVGANLTLDLTIVSANVHVIAGFFFSYDETNGVQFDAYLRVGGNVSLLGIISISIEFVLTLDYEHNNDGTRNYNQVTGSASLTVSVSVLGMSQSFTFSVSKTFQVGSPERAAVAGAAVTPGTPGRIGFGDLMTQADFAAYCGAFS
jgi:hypothetical protein